MLIIETVPDLRQNVQFWKKNGKCVSLVPTMGNLHQGHMALVDKARRRSDIVVVTIFVNPMQFGCINDFTNYPRTLQEDYKKLDLHNVDLVFSPTLSDIYPKGIKLHTFVEVPELSHILEGSSRPGHFRGVSTIISKLFNLVQPNLACFGEKDYQQLVLIRRMVEDMGYDIDIISIPIVREKDGLAFSSRNKYLTSDERNLAPIINQVMQDMKVQLINGENHIDEIVRNSERRLCAKGLRPDGLAIRDAETLLPIDIGSKYAVILMAVWIGKTRLIDNQIISLNDKM